MRLIAVLILIVLLIVLFSHLAFLALPSFFYQIIALLFLGTVGIYFFLVDVKKNKSEYFVQLYLATLLVKILAYGAFVLFVVWDDPGGATNNVLIFLITYFTFTAVEIIFLYRKVSS